MSSVVTIGSIYSGWHEDLPQLFSGLVIALELTGIFVVVGFPFGLLLAILVGNRNWLVRTTALLVVEIGRGMPLLVLLYIVYQGLPQIGLIPSGFVSAAGVFVWSAGAYSSEIIRGSIEALPAGQREAASAVGLSGLETARFVVLPQAARIALPGLMNLVIQGFQVTSLAFAIAVPEIMQQAFFLGSVSFEYMNVFVAAGVVYAAVTIPASALVTQLEKRLSRHL